MADIIFELFVMLDSHHPLGRSSLLGDYAAFLVGIKSSVWWDKWLNKININKK